MCYKRTVSVSVAVAAAVAVCWSVWVVPVPALAMTTFPSSASSRRVPVVGILAQPLKHSNDDNNNDSNGKKDNSYHYIAASYVKWCEAGGATAIAIPYNATQNLTLYDEILDAHVDGILLPGGSAPLSEGVVYLLDAVRRRQQAGRYIPVWGTCLGFEFLVQYMGDGRNTDNHASVLQPGYQAENHSWPLEQVVRRELYQDFVVYDAVTRYNVTLNNHQLGIRPDIFEAHPVLSAVWEVTSINHDERGVPFVSTIEPRDADNIPLYGVQYHPEKNAFEYGIFPVTGLPYEAIDHSAVGIQFSLRLAQFWIGKVRRAAALSCRWPEQQQSSCPRLTTISMTYPPLYTFPIRAGINFEQVHLIPADYPFQTTTSLVGLQQETSVPFR